MSKLRVHELAKKLNMSNQELIAKLNTKGILVRTHSSSVDEKAAMAALGLSDLSDVDSKKTRTVLRKRPMDKEVSLEHPVELKVEEKESESKPEAFAVSKQPFGQKDEEITVNKTDRAEHAQEKLEKPKQTQTISSEPVRTILSHERQASDHGEKVINTESRVSHTAEKVPVVQKSPSNVVRVIDADAIKARLASEGRTFGRRPFTPGGDAGRHHHNRQPGFERRDGRPPFERPSAAPVAPAPSPDASTTAATDKNYSKQSKKRKSPAYVREMKESSSGGKELWSLGKKKKSPTQKTTQITTAAAHKRVVGMTETITVNDLAHAMSVKAADLISRLISMGMMVTVNQAIDFETASIVASEFGFEVKNVSFEETDLIKEEKDDADRLKPRAPIVTVMGHVDHGKTSVLDALRQSAVAKGEAGGITQHIGAYSVKTEHGLVTFLDTPGHEAFSSMRARGAQVTDIVVLVVAANDGVMPQTLEAIDHAKAAKAPVVVAINKIDLPDAKPDRVMQQLSEHGLIPEEWGGETQFFKISALKKTGLKELVDGLIALSEVMELRANYEKPAVGCVIEAKLDKGRGPVATILPQSGVLKQGDYIVAGKHMGRVRAMYDSNGHKLNEAGPSMPVQVLGLSGVPTSGDKVNVVADDKTAKTIVDHRSQKDRERELLKNKNISLENFLSQTPTEAVKTLHLIVKADVYGSSEALTQALLNLSTNKVKVDVIHTGVGTITESNVNLAMASKATIIGFNIKADGKAQALAQQEKIDLRYYSVIYDALEEVKKAMSGLLAPVFEESYLGKAEVRQVISVSKFGKIAGCYVLDGKIVRSAKVSLKRKGQELFKGSISSLKRFKDDVKDVSSGYECGISLENFSDIQEGDIIECFELKETKASLGEAISSLKSSDKQTAA